MQRNIDISIRDHVGKDFNFTGPKELSEFLREEISFWSAAQSEVEKHHHKLHHFLNAHGTLRAIKNIVDGWSEKIEEWDEKKLHTELNNLRNGYLSTLHQNWLWRGHSFTDQFIRCNLQYENHAAQGFIETVHQKNTNGISNPRSFFGVMAGYEYLTQDSEILSRRKSETSSFDRLREELQRTTINVTSETEKIKEAFKKWDGSTKTSWQDQLATFGNQHITQQTEMRDEFIAYMSGCHTRIEVLENLYQEKLRLSGPATYWKEAAKKYTAQGYAWALTLVTALAVGIFCLSDFFLNWLNGAQIPIKLNTVQGAIMFGSILALYAFLIRSLSRLTFSAMHLMRDAEEREQLTHLYLALNQDSGVDEQSRSIVLQALFSRTETGLLASESGPTMPGVPEIMKAVSSRS